jgi:hypothetical protein
MTLIRESCAFGGLPEIDLWGVLAEKKMVSLLFYAIPPNFSNSCPKYDNSQGDSGNK